MKPCCVDASDVETMVNDIDCTQHLDGTSATTTSQKHLIIHGNKQSLAEKTFYIAYEGLHPPTIHAEFGSIRNSNKEGRSPVVLVPHAWQELSMLQSSTRMNSISRMAGDPKAWAVAAQWIVQAIDAKGKSSLDGAMGIIRILDPLGDACSVSYGADASLLAINASIVCRREAVSFSDNHDTLMPARHFSLGRLLLDRAINAGSIWDKQCAIKYLTGAAGIDQGGHAFQIEVLHSLSKAHVERFKRIGGLADVDFAIISRSRIITFDGQTHEAYVLCLGGIGSLYEQRYNTSGSIEDPAKAIEYQTKSLDLTAEEDKSQTVALQTIGNCYDCRFERLGQLQDINRAVECQIRAVHLTPKGHADMLNGYNNLGTSYLRRFYLLGELEDIGTAIECQTWAVQLTPEGHAWMPHGYNNLGASYKCRFQRLGDLGDINRAIECRTRAVELTSEDHANMPSWYNNLRNSYTCRFERLGERGDINRAIESETQAVQLTTEGHAYMPILYSNLGTLHAHRFERQGELEDINRAIVCKTRVVQLTPEGYVDMPGRNNNLGTAYNRRFERLGELEDISGAIECQNLAVQLTPEGYPDMPSGHISLSTSYLCRFERLGELEDINRAIECQNRAFQFAPEGHADMPSWYDNLGNSYQSRFERLGELGGINRTIDCRNPAVQRTSEGHPDMPSRYSNLGLSYKCRIGCLGELVDINRAIECQTWAVQLTPEGHPEIPGLYNSLGASHAHRSQRLGQLEDINRAIECQTWAVQLTPEGHPDMPRMYNDLGASHARRFKRLGEVEDVNRAIECQTLSVQLTPEGHAYMPSWYNSLGCSHARRFQRLGELQDIDRAIECQTQAVMLTPEDHADIPCWYTNLGVSHASRFELSGEQNDLKQATECSHRAVLLAPEEHTEMPRFLLNFGNMVCRQSMLLEEQAGILMSIEVYARALHLLPEHHNLISHVQTALGRSYHACWRYLKRPNDLVVGLQYLEAAACSSTGPPTVRFEASRAWAHLLSELGISMSLKAYHTTMRLLPQIVWLGTTVERRYDCVHEIGTLGMEAAAAAISAANYGLALEWLEEARSIVWNQMLQLRAPIEDLAAVDPVLAQRLQQVSVDLERASTRVADPSPLEASTMDLQQNTLRHHRLADQYHTLIDQARNLPGFQDFMRPRKVVDLMPAAQRGVVVVVNIHTERCDALILRPGANEVAHVFLPDLSLAEVAQLHNLMVQTLKAHNVRERAMSRLNGQPGDQFEYILTALWNRLVKPILKFLGYTSKFPVDQLPHITWCTTGALSFLPIHAAGIYHPGGDHIFDYAITSYTPTLGALLASPSKSHIEPAGVLAVGQRFTPGLSNLPGTKQELTYIKKHVDGLPFMQLEDSQATPADVLDAMCQYTCVHLACHASQDSDDPRKSCFHLHNGTLSLDQIARRSMKNKKLAFLSACQTAAGDQKMPDEAIHLAAGMIIAGYSSVIATMWSIKDKNAPIVSDHVYSQLVKDGKLDCTQVARALHTAVGVLRNRVGGKAFSDWAPFVHIGI